jgi:hypothetical protein
MTTRIVQTLTNGHLSSCLKPGPDPMQAHVFRITPYVEFNTEQDYQLEECVILTGELVPY